MQWHDGKYVSENGQIIGWTDTPGFRVGYPAKVFENGLVQELGYYLTEGDAMRAVEKYFATKPTW